MKIFIPTRDTPGYLRRQKRALEYKARLKQQQVGNDDPALIDEMAAFLAPLVVQEEPDAKRAVDAVMDLSEAQFMDILDALTGGGKHSAVPPQSSTPSESSTSPE